MDFCSCKDSIVVAEIFLDEMVVVGKCLSLHVLQMNGEEVGSRTIHRYIHDATPSRS